MRDTVHTCRRQRDRCIQSPQPTNASSNKVRDYAPTDPRQT